MEYSEISKIKSLGGGKFEGYLVVFSDTTTPDLHGDFFTKDSKFGFKNETDVPLFYDHGFNSIVKTAQIGTAQLKIDNIGVKMSGELSADAELWAGVELEKQKQYFEAIESLVKSGLMGAS